MREYTNFITVITSHKMSLNTYLIFINRGVKMGEFQTYKQGYTSEKESSK